MGGDPLTATYDGRLAVNPKTKTIGACCRTLDEAVMRRQVYISQKGVLMLRNLDEAKGKLNSGSPMVCCPYCGARVNDPGFSQGGFIPPELNRLILIGDSKDEGVSE